MPYWYWNGRITPAETRRQILRVPYARQDGRPVWLAPERKYRLMPSVLVRSAR